MDKLGVILVDHGSRREESNALLLDVVRQFAETTGLPIVEPAHMELAEPSIATAFARCVERGRDDGRRVSLLSAAGPALERGHPAPGGGGGPPASGRPLSGDGAVRSASAHGGDHAAAD